MGWIEVELIPSNSLSMLLRPNVVLMLVHRLWCLPNIKPTKAQGIVIAELCMHIKYIFCLLLKYNVQYLCRQTHLRAGVCYVMCF